MPLFCQKAIFHRCPLDRVLKRLLKTQQRKEEKKGMTTNKHNKTEHKEESHGGLKIQQWLTAHLSVFITCCSAGYWMTCMCSGGTHRSGLLWVRDVLPLCSLVQMLLWSQLLYLAFFRQTRLVELRSHKIGVWASRSIRYREQPCHR